MIDQEIQKLLSLADLHVRNRNVEEALKVMEEAREKTNILFDEIIENLKKGK